MKQFTTGVTSDGRVYIQDEDFTHDARLYINGDFLYVEQEIAYAETICEMLNKRAKIENILAGVRATVDDSVGYEESTHEKQQQFARKRLESMYGKSK